MQIELWPIDRVKPYANNPRVNDGAVDSVAASLREFGWRQPIVVDQQGVIIVGHTRIKAAEKLGLIEVPVHVATELSPEQIKAYRIADNQTASIAEWDKELLPIEIGDLKAVGYDLGLLGFEPDELQKWVGTDVAEGQCDADEVPTARHECADGKRHLPSGSDVRWRPRGQFPPAHFSRCRLTERSKHSRRYRRGYIEVPKKNGKSALFSGLSLYLLIADNEPGAEIYSAAVDRDQASIVFNEASNMVEASPALSSKLDVVRSTKRVVFKQTRSVYRALSADAPAKEGLNAHAVLIDELHAQKNRDLWDTLRYAGAGWQRTFRSKRMPRITGNRRRRRAESGSMESWR